MTKTQQREIVKDIRKQLRWIEEAITRGDQEWINQYAMQLSATAQELESE